MFTPYSRCSVSLKYPHRTNERISRIRQLLTRALGEIREQTRLSPAPISPKRRSEESSESESIQEILTNLRRGYLVTKHSEGSTAPHAKFVYLSEDTRYLCWKSLER